MNKENQLPNELFGLGKINVSIDRGGTFTDCVGTYPVYSVNENGEKATVKKTIVIKLLSEDPQHYADAPQEGIRRILEQVTGIEHPRNKPLDTSNLGVIRMGTTVATNALLERKGEPTILVTTKGFRDLLEIGNQARPNLFDLKIERPEILYKHVVEIDERVTLVGYQLNPLGVYGDVPNLEEEAKQGNIIKGVSGEYVRVLKKPDLDAVEKTLRKYYDEGIRSIAICFLHSYTFPDHEIEVGKLASKIGYTHASLSSQVMPMIKAVPRGHSATADGYLTPAIKRYLAGFVKGFDEGIHDTKKVRLEFMQSDGGLTPVHKFSGLRAILSGPAAGVVGYGQTTFNEKTGAPVIGLDIGGTSTDVSRYGGQLEHVFETTTAGISILAPQLDINTVAAGGGSRLFLRNGMFEVGPESAGANPGPACYRKGGPLTITDANLVLGRLRTDYFPKIFGKNENEPLGSEEPLALFKDLIEQIVKEKVEQQKGQNLPNVEVPSIEEVALGFIQVACESVCRSIRKLTEERGFDTESHSLAAFGGAGAQLACSVAKTLGIKTVYVHRNASVLSAYGLSLAEVVEEKQIPSAQALNDSESMSEILSHISELKTQCKDALEAQGFKDSLQQIELESMLNMRYEGTDTSIMIGESFAKVHKKDILAKSPGISENELSRLMFIQEFIETHRREFGFVLDGPSVIVDDIRVRGAGKFYKIKHGQVHDEVARLHENNLIKVLRVDDSKKCKEVVKVYFEDRYMDTGIYMLNELEVGDKVCGPAIVLDNNNTILVEPNWETLITESQVVLTFNKEKSDGFIQPTKNQTTSESELVSEPQFESTPAQMSVFLHRFMSIAEQMGHTLQKTSISTNIKERLDFSCALFDPEGGLVANAPHIPVHLGSMSHAVRFQMKYWGEDGLNEGDVICTNHPAAGGTHLPDITVITPVFEEIKPNSDPQKKRKILFFVAARGHHADIGGITPGSMPPNSKYLYEEGASMIAFKVIDKGVFKEKELIRQLVDIPASHEGCSGSRRVSDVLSDLKAQISANQKGIQLVYRLINEYSLHTVHSYMRLIQKTAEQAVRTLLRQVYEKNEGKPLNSIDFMDDGSQICLKVTIDHDNGSAVFDFTNTSPQVYGNTNAPQAVTHSAILYSLRCMIAGYLPLNQGCLIPIKVILPKNSLLNPSIQCAVVGGNVLTSQRVVDVVFKAFSACAASQGCTNNFTFGVPPETMEDGSVLKGWGYYETIAGGHGAGPGWHGKSGVHTHITNTRITDPEILERRYPVLLREFSIRKNSGGLGQFNGGDGCIRDVEFLTRLQVSLLSERRVFAPYGLFGGEDGKKGLNLHYIKNEKSSDEQREIPMLNGNGNNNGSEDDYIIVYLGSKATVFVNPGDRIVINTPGAGAWGSKEN
ncbi:hypothetical protein BB559_006947 [Furculomyces boomerangus]|uniref:5-oxoprolinase n=1 Tax=Furculomyces boomerangus TaxID=61424 RepID=A0A2T9XZQ4_9FUNG|nr:hypothetical protein BB559_006947 [Furculomyces boomerangus]